MNRPAYEDLVKSLGKPDLARYDQNCCMLNGTKRCPNFVGNGSRSQATQRIEGIICRTAADTSSKAQEVLFSEAAECRKKREEGMISTETEDAPPSPSD